MKDENKTKAELIKELKFLREEREKGVFEDTTEHKKVEQIILESENRFRELFTHMSSGVAIYEAKDNGKDFIIKDFNRAGEKMSKVKRENIIGKSVLKVFPKVKTFGLFKVFQEVYKTGKPQHYPISFYQDQRISGWRENYVYKLPSGEVIAIYDDITERKKAENRLREEEKLFNTLMDNILDSIYFKDKEKRFIRVNRVKAEHSGVAPEEMIGKTDFDFFPKEIAIQSFADDNHIMESGKSIIDKIEKIIHSDKTEYWVSTTKVPWHDDEGRITGVIGISRDITERKQVQKALQEAHDQLENKVAQRTKELQKANLKLQELDQLKTIFIVSMSHELRTPLSLIIGFTDIILQEISGKINQEQRRQFALVKKNAEHLLYLINDVLDINKIETGKVEMIIEEFDLSALSRDIKDNFIIDADKKGLVLSLEAPPTLPLESDRRRTRQILENLLSNALKFTYRGEIKIKVVLKNETVEVYVRDTGIGIKKENMDKLFNSFSQIANQDRIEEGTGLGLYLSKKNAHLLGGDIMAESDFGKGSVFTLILPLKYKETKG